MIGTVHTSMSATYKSNQTSTKLQTHLATYLHVGLFHKPVCTYLGKVRHLQLDELDAKYSGDEQQLGSRRSKRETGVTPVINNIPYQPSIDVGFAYVEKVGD